jgi:DNA-3-methyladenine glycosylase
MPLQSEFYAQPTLSVARQLLGARLVRVLDGLRVTALITETEAYIGETDLACHARAGRTARTSVMYGPPGRTYVYFIYGVHWMLNAVTEPAGRPAAVLIRAAVLEEKVSRINGPAKLTRALAITASQNDLDLTADTSDLWIEPGLVISDANVTIGPRVGLYRVPEPWKSMPWRFLVNKLPNLEE